jgi:hypothetical protein
MRDAGLDGRVQIIGAHAQHAVHPRQVDRDASDNRIDVPFERRPDAKRHNRRTLSRGHRHDRTDFFGAGRVDDDVRRRRRVPGFAVTVMLDLGRVRRAAIAEQTDEVADERVTGTG